MRLKNPNWFNAPCRDEDIKELLKSEHGRMTTMRLERLVRLTRFLQQHGAILIPYNEDNVMEALPRDYAMRSARLKNDLFALYKAKLVIGQKQKVIRRKLLS